MDRTMIVVSCISVFLCAPSTTPPQETSVPRPSRMHEFATTHQPLPSVMQLAEQLRAGPTPEAGSAATILANTRAALVEELLAIAKRPHATSEDGSRRRQAILLLARYGARESVEFFVRNVTLKVDWFLTTGVLPSLECYPCAIALTEIGQSSVAPILAHLHATAPEGVSDTAIELYAWVLLDVYGSGEGGDDEAIAVLKRAIDRTPVGRRDNVERLMVRMRQLTEQRP